MKLSDGMSLYHGSYAPITEVDLTCCAAGKDFGRGFYLTSDEAQARSFIRTSLAKARRIGAVSPSQNHGYVSEFRFRAPAIPLRVYEFPTADRQWLWFVSANRRQRLAEQLRNEIDPAVFNSDVVIGKVANDATNPVITAYLNGIYGPLDNPSSADMAISLLLPERLKDQYCFLTERAVSCLEHKGVIRYEP